jgi:phosphoglycolate phosphatase
MPTPQMGFDALIFDIDGTLWNASPASAKGWNLGLAKLGINRKLSPEQIKKVAGHPFEECVDILLPGLRTKTPELFDTLNKCETEAVKSEGGKFFDGALDSLKQLAAEYKIFLVSNCQQWYLDLFLDFSKLRTWLAGFDCYGLSGLSKAEMLLRLKSHHALNHPLYIGDTAGDETSAKQARIAFLYVSWGFGKPAGKPTTVNSFIELLSYLNHKKSG